MLWQNGPMIGRPGHSAEPTAARRTAVVELDGVVKRYRGAGELALDGIDVRVDAGEFFGLLGPNGSGKTTTISIACGLLRPTRGEARVCGEPAGRNIGGTKRRIGLVPQELALYPTLTLEENLGYFGAMHGLRGPRLNERVADCLRIARLESVAKRRVSTFSGGMKRRANLVVGIIHTPQVLFLDEPSLGVDPQSREVMFDSLQELRESGTTLIYTSHNMAEVQRLCTRVGILDRGSIIAEGTPDELIARTPDCADLGEVFLALTGRQLRE